MLILSLKLFSWPRSLLSISSIYFKKYVLNALLKNVQLLSNGSVLLQHGGLFKEVTNESIEPKGLIKDDLCLISQQLADFCSRVY